MQFSRSGSSIRKNTKGLYIKDPGCENTTGEKAEFRLSVRELVEFLRRDGSLDDRVSARAEQEAMLKGARLHRKLQSSAGPDYQSEVPLSVTIEYNTYFLTIEGRADGVFCDASHEPEIKVIDEIKGVYLPLEEITEPIRVHLAQALCYAYVLAEKEDLPEIGVRITYIQMDDEEIKRFRSDWSREDLTGWFEDLIDEYRKFTDLHDQRIRERDNSMQTLSFPFPYREGQKALVSGVYRTIQDEKKMFLQASTGIGKTMAVLYPSIRAVGEGKAQKIFYLSARTVAQAAPIEAFRILREQGLRFRAMRLTAKEKSCFMNEPSCNPQDCPYAASYFSKRPEAILSLLEKGDDFFDREEIRKAAEQYKVCPYELSLDLSLWLDAIICDYNYAFDPDASLKRYFAEHSRRDYIFLIDEAHNLVDRARNMYSASIIKEDILKARKLVKDRSKKAEKAFSSINKKMLVMKRELEEEWEGRRGIPYKMLPGDGGLFADALTAMGEIEKLFDEERDAELKKELLNTYFMLRSYVNMAEYVDEHYVIFEEIDAEGHFYVKEYCIDPSAHIKERLSCAKGAVFFSATLLPIAYYRDLLGAEESDYGVYAGSPFDPDKRGIFIVGDVSSKYTRRGEAEYRRIAKAISEVVNSRRGNYMVFFPSHKMMTDVFKIYREEFDREDVNWVVQGKYMTEMDREIFMEDFEEPPENKEGSSENDKSLVGFCVMGGIFSEGIDLTGERLVGAIIVGTGLPQVSNEGEILKNAYTGKRNGFDYAYRYPGMNKVLQAAGRVIRTAEDTGVIVLLDERFLEKSSQKLFPREWETFMICDSDNIGPSVKDFWENGKN